MTLANVKTFASGYVAAAKQAGSWSASTDNFVGLQDKIAKQVTIDGFFGDKLAGYLDGDELPLGKTIEEYFIDLTLPSAMSGNNNTEGAKMIEVELPPVESCVYNYTLGRKKIKTSVPYDNYERAMLSSEGTGELTAKIVERLQNSYDITKFAIKKQLLGNCADKAVTAGKKATLDVPVDESTGEAFIKQVKKDIEEASFPNEHTLGGQLAGAAPECILFIKKGVMPSIEVDTIAGAFQRDALAIPARVVVVDDFGSTTDSNIYALLVDPRGVKLHNGYNAVREGTNPDADTLNLVKHFEFTGFISKYCYVQAYTHA